MNKIKSMFIILCTLLLFISSPQLLVHATEGGYNGGGHSAEGGELTDTGGASVAKTGVRAYVVDQNGNVVSKVVDYVAKAPNASKYFYSTRIGNAQASERLIISNDLPLPVRYETTFVGNGQPFREFMLSKNSSGQQRIQEFIVTAGRGNKRTGETRGQQETGKTANHSS